MLTYETDPGLVLKEGSLERCRSVGHDQYCRPRCSVLHMRISRSPACTVATVFWAADQMILTIFSELIVTIQELDASCHCFAYKMVMVRIVKKQVMTVLATFLR